MTKYIFSVPWTMNNEPELLCAVVVAENYIDATDRLFANDPIWKGKGVALLDAYLTKEAPSIKFGMV